MTKQRPSNMEIGDQLTEEGIQRLKVGQVLIFDYEGSPLHLKITKLNRKSHKCWVKDVTLYKESDIEAMSDEEYERLRKHGS